MSKYSLELKEVSKEFSGIRALRELSLNIEQGAIIGLTGPNGAGKTTLFDVISGVEKPSTGEVKVLNTSIKNLNTVKIAQLGVRRTFQNVRLFENMTVEDNVLVACNFIWGVNLIPIYLSRIKVRMEWKKNLQQVLQILDSVNLLEKRYSLASNLSHGQRRLLELCRAMIRGAKLLLLDEPTAGVFPETREILIKKIRRYREETKATIIIIEHGKHLLDKVCDRVIRLEHGQIVV